MAALVWGAIGGKGSAKGALQQAQSEYDFRVWAEQASVPLPADVARAGCHRPPGR